MIGSEHLRFLAAAAVASLAAGCMTTREALPPRLPATALPDELSSISITVTTPLATLRQQFEAAAPRNVAAKPYDASYGGALAKAVGGVRYGYHVTRDPLRVAAARSRIRVSTVAHYWIRGRFGPMQDGALLRPVTDIAKLIGACPPGVAAIVCSAKDLADVLASKPIYLYASCGTGEQKPRRVELGASFAIAIRKNWDVIVSHELAPARPLDSCCLVLPDCVYIPIGGQLRPAKRALKPGFDTELRLLNNDVTVWVINAFASELKGMLKAKLEEDETVGSLRRQAEAVWATTAAEPIRIDDSSWLAVNPEGIALSPVTIDRNGLTATARLAARPRITRGVSPAPAAAPFPAELGSAQIGEAFSVLLPVDVSYELLAREVRAALRVDEGGLRYPTPGGGALQVTDIGLSGYGSQIMVRFVLEGDAQPFSRTRITGYLVGTPRYDEARERLSFPDLEYSAETSDLLATVAEWLAHDEIRDALRAQLVVDLGGRVADARSKVQRAMNRRYGTVELAGELQALELAGIYSLDERDALRTYIRARGTLRATAE